MGHKLNNTIENMKMTARFYKGRLDKIQAEEKNYGYVYSLQWNGEERIKLLWIVREYDIIIADMTANEDKSTWDHFDYLSSRLRTAERALLNGNFIGRSTSIMSNLIESLQAEANQTLYKELKSLIKIASEEIDKIARETFDTPIQ